MDNLDELSIHIWMCNKLNLLATFYYFNYFYIDISEYGKLNSPEQSVYYPYLPDYKATVQCHYAAYICVILVQ